MTAIGQAIRSLSGKGEQYYIVGIVTSVNEGERTCSVQTISNEGELTLSEVNLMAETDDGLLMIPAIDSTVIVSYSEKVNYFVALYSELQKVVMIVGDSGIEMAPDKITLNDGSYGGLVKVEDLVKKINGLENLVNSILQTLKTTVIPLASSGTYPFAPLYSSTNPIAPITNRNDIENKTVIHGDSI